MIVQKQNGDLPPFPPKTKHKITEFFVQTCVNNY